MKAAHKPKTDPWTNFTVAGYEVQGKIDGGERRQLKQFQRARGIKATGKMDKTTRKHLAKVANRVGHNDSFVLGQRSSSVLETEKQLKGMHLKHGKIDGVLDKKSLAGVRQALRQQPTDQFDVNAYRQAYDQYFAGVGGGTPGEASQTADQILRGGFGYRDDIAGVNAISDANDVNDGADTASGSARYQSAAAALTQNYGLEQNELKRLSAADQGAYQAVSKQLQAANDPVAGLALQKLLFDGKFSGGLAQQLGPLASGQASLAGSVDRRSFLADLVQECAVPAAINQGPVGSCGPTALEQDLATKDPAEYARLAIGVAGPEGRVQMKGGMELVRPPGTESDDGSRRSSVQRMLGSAMYEVSNGAANYQGPHDMNGSWGIDLAKLRSQLEGKPQNVAILQSADQNGAALQGIDQMLAANQQPVVQLAYGNTGGRHYLLVTGRGSDENGPYVEMVNPIGRVERMSEADFTERLYEVHYDPAVVDARTASSMGWNPASAPTA